MNGELSLLKEFIRAIRALIRDIRVVCCRWSSERSSWSRLVTEPSSHQIRITPLRPKLQRSLSTVIVLLLLVVFQIASTPQFAAQTVTAEQSAPRKTSTPYKGDLSIFESPDRDKKLQIERVMDILGIHSGSNVADIGAGSGWFTIRAAKRVGERGTVYAEDINPEAITYIGDRLRKEGISNVRTILGTPDDPKLPENSVDSVLILKTYHEIAAPVRLLENLRKALHSGARLGIIDRNGNGEDHGIQKDVIMKEAARAGYHLTAEHDFVKADREDYFLVFEPEAH
jgi:SAM-dependent methyltransferase